MAENNIAVMDNEAEQRFEASVDGTLSLLRYERTDDQITYLHTEVPDELEGRGIGSALARAALDDARARKLTVVPRCPFIGAYIQRHPEYLSIIDPAFRSQLG